MELGRFLADCKTSLFKTDVVISDPGGGESSAERGRRRWEPQDEVRVGYGRTPYQGRAALLFNSRQVITNRITKV